MTVVNDQKVQLEMSPELKALFDGISAQLASTQTELRDVKSALTTQKSDTQRTRETAARAEVAAIMAKLMAGDELRYGKEEVEALTAAYMDAKLGVVSENAEIATFAGKMATHLDKIAAARSPLVPGGEKKPADKTTAALAKTDFEGAGEDSEARLATAIDAYIEEHKLTGPKAYMTAYAALAKSVGLTMPAAALGGGSDIESDEE